MDAVSNAVVTVKKNIQDLDQVTLTNLTQQAITLEELYGIDMNETLRGVNALMVNFGMDAQTAMDYIVKGTQNSLDKTNELGDNLSEYSGKFAQAGYSAQEYFQLLQNGLEGGAYNLDKVNDAINEVTTRLVDGTIADAIGMYSGKTQELFESWKNGGATQKEVINSIVEDINGCTNQQEALNMAATAFGTMAEDGSAKFITSLTTMGTAYDDVAGSAQNMFDQSTTESQKFEASMRKLKEALIPLGEILVNLANTILPPLAKGIQAIGDFFGKLPEPGTAFCSDIRWIDSGICSIGTNDRSGRIRSDYVENIATTDYSRNWNSSVSNHWNHSVSEELGSCHGMVRKFVDYSERKMRKSIEAGNLFVFHGNNPSSMGWLGWKIPRSAGMVVRNLAASG